MSGAVPDLLDSIVARYRGVLRLSHNVAGWTLSVDDREIGIKGSFQSSQRHVISGMAMAWERFRDGYLHGPQRCTCGRLYAEHAWDAKKASEKGACPSGTGRYQPQAPAVLAGREESSG